MAAEHGGYAEAGNADSELEQILKRVPSGATAADVVNVGKGQMRRGRISNEHVKPGSTRALKARESAMRERAKLQLVKRGDTYLAPKTRSTTVLDRQKLMARRDRSLGHAGPPAKYDYQHQSRRRVMSADHRSIAPGEWFAWQAGQGADKVVGMIGGKQQRAAGGQPGYQSPPAVVRSASEPVVSPLPAGTDAGETAVETRASRRSSGRRTTGSPWAHDRASSGPAVVLSPDARMSKPLTLSGGQMEAPSSASPAAAAAAAATAAVAADARAQLPTELPSERIHRLANEQPNKFASQSFDDSSSHLSLGLQEEAGTISPMGVDLNATRLSNKRSGQRKHRATGHRSGAFTAAPTHPAKAGKPHATRDAPAESANAGKQQRRVLAGVEPSASALDASDIAAMQHLQAELAASELDDEGRVVGHSGDIRQSSSAFQVKPSDIDPGLKTLGAIQLQTQWNMKMSQMEIQGCGKIPGWIPAGPRPGSASQRPNRPPSAPLERRRQANAARSKKGDLKARGKVRPPSREGSQPHRYESPREIVPAWRSGSNLSPEALLTGN